MKNISLERAQEKIQAFNSLIENYSEGAANTRYKSWEWCHKAFLEYKTKQGTLADDEMEAAIDYLALQLGFYLASWGMYRGSSFLLQRDYKTHKEAIRIIIEHKYDVLWNFDPSAEDAIDHVADLLFDKENGLNKRILEAYLDTKAEKDEFPEEEASDTLVTKILMGTFGCCPAYDRFLKQGIKCLQDNPKIYEIRVGDKLTQAYSRNSFLSLCHLYQDHKVDFCFDCKNISYPPMKRVDMYLWEIGYELSLADELEKLLSASKRDSKKIKRIKKLIGNLGKFNCLDEMKDEEIVAGLRKMNGEKN